MSCWRNYLEVSLGDVHQNILVGCIVSHTGAIRVKACLPASLLGRALNGASAYFAVRLTNSMQPAGEGHSGWYSSCTLTLVAPWDQVLTFRKIGLVNINLFRFRLFRSPPLLRVLFVRADAQLDATAPKLNRPRVG